MSTVRSHALRRAAAATLLLAGSLGIAIDEGLLGGPETPVMPFFTAYAPDETDARRMAMTLGDLLTRRRGIAWTTEGGYGTGEHSTDQLESSNAWIRFVLDQPMDTTPGSRFDYNDGVSVLPGRILREATGQPVEEWTKSRLFKPIGITQFQRISVVDSRTAGIERAHLFWQWLRRAVRGVSPEHDLVAVFNGGDIHGGAERSTYLALQERILPAVSVAP